MDRFVRASLKVDYALPDGRLMPGCAYNMLYRHKDPRFTGARGTTPIWGRAAHRERQV